jgi:hypothetical protein
MCSKSCRHKCHNHPWNKLEDIEEEDDDGKVKKDAIFPSKLSKDEK